MSEAGAAQGTRYGIDVRGSRFTIQGYVTGLLSAVGHDPVIAARELSGHLMFSPDNAAASEVHLRIAARSLSVQNDVKDRDRREIERAMFDEVLEVAQHPDIAYDATAARVETVDEGRLRVHLDGQLSLHGVTRGQPVAAQVFLTGDTLRAQGAFEIRQSSYQIKPFSAAGGTLKLKDELKCTFDLVARKAG